MFAKCVFMLILVGACISDVLCQQPGGNGKSKQWNDFLRDWNILMRHIFTKEEEDILANCCHPGQSKALVQCIKGSHFTRREYEELKKAVQKWRANKLQRGEMSMWDLNEKFKKLLECMTKIPKAGLKSSE